LARQSAEFSEWLQARRPELEGAALARVYHVSDPASVKDPDYVVGLRAAVSAALDYGLIGIELGEERAGPAPATLLVQARYAARSGVGLDTVLQRYIAGYALLGDFVVRAIEEGDFTAQAVDLRRILRIQATLLERLVDAVTAEYRQEMRSRTRTAEERRLELVKRLLAGQFLEADELQYEFDAWHIGTIACGPGAETVIRDLAAKLDRRLLLVRPGGGTLWAWFGGRSKVPTKSAESLIQTPRPPELSLAIGEPERGLAGWRLTHRQAKAAAPIASRPSPQLVRYADVALLASALQDDVLASSLQRLYLDPLLYERDGGAALRRTLRAYFVASRHVSSTAAVLRVSRQTVAVRLRTVEDWIGRSLDTCASEMDTALRMQELSHPSSPAATSAFE
jgi:PucR-like helix-turn-helix protein/diguanylate cyclase with GGDEF domain